MTRMLPHRRSLGQFLLLALLLFFSVFNCKLYAQIDEAGIASKLVNKPLFLRGLWGEDRLRFDIDGQPLTSFKIVSFTEAGIDVRRVKLREGHLQISAQRVGLEFDKAGHVQRVPLSWNAYAGNISIDVQAAAGQNFDKALKVIFAESLAELVPQLPSFWAEYGQAHFLEPAPAATPLGGTSQGSPAGTEPKSAGSDVPPLEKHRGVTPPKLLKQVDPAFSGPALGLGYSSTVEVYMWVDVQGQPTHLKIVKPAGLGLDEQALRAVLGYRFAPATQNGKPIKVDLYVDVNFKTF